MLGGRLVRRLDHRSVWNCYFSCGKFGVVRSGIGHRITNPCGDWRGAGVASGAFFEARRFSLRSAGELLKEGGVGGGVFNRAEGLAEEIGADLWAKRPQELLEKLVAQKDRRATADQRTVGRTRRTTPKSAAA